MTPEGERLVHVRQDPGRLLSVNSISESFVQRPARRLILVRQLIESDDNEVGKVHVVLEVTEDLAFVIGLASGFRGSTNKDVPDDRIACDTNELRIVLDDRDFDERAHILP